MRNKPGASVYRSRARRTRPALPVPVTAADRQAAADDLAEANRRRPTRLAAYLAAQDR
jgi:hypothetical protein